MIQSMTGFANKTLVLKTDHGTHANVVINIKSFNSRFFEITSKVPAPLSFIETEIIQLLKKRLVRGHVYLTIQMDNPHLFTGAIQPVMPIVDGYCKAIEQIQKHCLLAKEPISINTVIRLPDIFCVEEKQIDAKTVASLLNEINQSIDAVTKTRLEEGMALYDDIQKRIEIMRAAIILIEQESLRVIEQQKQKIHKVMTDALPEDSTVNEVRKTNLYAVLDKMDINEELVRFVSHLDNIAVQMDSDVMEKGKRLDFTVQELAREVNTMSAKCSDARISHQVINIKVEIEKIREQIQNIV